MTEIKELEKLLPIGTVAAVRIQEKTSLAMVIGYCPQTGDDKVIWDYLAVPYPEGLGEKAKVLVFDQDSVGKVIASGCTDEQELAHRGYVMALREALKNQR